MTFRSAAALALLVLAPLAAAHAGPPEDVYDPLEMDLHAFPHPDGALREAEPEAAAVPFRSAEPALAFSMPATMPFSLQRGATARVVLEAARPVPGNDANGMGVEVHLTRDGTSFASRQAALPQLLLPGQPATVDVRFEPLNEPFPSADGAVGLVVRPLFPLVDDESASLLVGPQRTRLDFDSVRLDGPSGLLLWPGDVIVFETAGEAFRPEGQAFTVRAGHDSATLDKASGFRKPLSWLILLVDEPFDVAERNHERFDTAARREAAHAWRAGGREVLGYPGVGVAVRVPTEGETLVVECVKGCPEGGFRRVVALETDPGDSFVDDQSALIPPPRNPPPTPAEEAPAPASETPGAPVLAALLVAAALLRRSARR